MLTAIYPGSFDPIHNGHLDLIRRASKIFDKVIVLIAVNSAKNSCFSLEERCEMINSVISEYKNVETDLLDGLLIEYAYQKKVNVLIRGLRAVCDFEYEYQMASINRRIHKEIETFFLVPSEEYMFISSRMVKEVAMLNGSIDSFVPALVKERLMKKIREKSRNCN